MPIDPTIALGYKPTDGLQTLGSLLNIQSQQQGMQVRDIQMQGARQQNEAHAITLNETKALQPFLADPRNYTDEAGNVDQARLYKGVMSLAPTTGAERINQMGQMQQSMTTAQNSILGLDTTKRTLIGNVLSSVEGADPEIAHKTLDVIERMSPQLAPAIKLARSMYDGTPKDQRSETFKSFARAVLPQPVQQEMNTPGGVTVSDGQQSVVISTKPGTSVPVGQDIPGTRVQQQLPPQTPVMGRDENGNPTPGYLGPQPGRRGSPEANGSATTPASTQERLRILNDELANAKSEDDRSAIKREIARLHPKGGGFVASGLPVGQAENIANNVGEMNRHFGALQDQAAGVQLTQSLGGNIKSLAQKAITGSQQDKLSFMNGLLTLIPGQHAQDDLKTATDLLQKNMAQLGLNTPASSDAMRALVTAARPNTAMSKEAVTEAVDQLVGQVKANMAMRNVLSSYKQYGDVEGYNRMRQRLEQTADPRVWQYESLPADQRRAFIQKLSPEDRAALVKKAKQLHEMGVIQ